MERTLPTALPPSFAEQSRSKKICIYAILVALFSLLGWIAETLFFLLAYGDFFDRGLLMLPFCPLYGLSALAVYALLRTPQTGLWGKWIQKSRTKTARLFTVAAVLLCYAAAAALLATVGELATGFVFDKFFDVHLWTYEDYPLNLFGYVCLPFSLLWGVLIVTAMSLVWHPMQGVLARAPIAPLAVVAGILSTAITFDFIFNIVHLILSGHRFLL